MASDLIDTCMAETKRTYGAGYGFALGYLTTSPGVWELRRMFEQANEIASRMIRRKSFHKLGITSDVVDYVEARANAPERGGWPWWLIEAAQLVHGDAMQGNAKSAEVMKLWKHPGY